ncbi:MAG: glycerol-3-phosphate 1-O-acyltransferase PlsY [Candidatus Omnitrophica bacterium]|nr:glycerol-3-phosphate 1-O-acyltransferase PlsY [Candidatus Omnitrophota bacterium]
MPWIILALAIIISYLTGSIPTAYIFGRIFKGIDIRKSGSGNIGATNALRVLGKKAGITVLALDILKGFLAVFILSNLLKDKILIIPPEMLGIILGIACIVGHNWTVFLNFKGGKGVATTLGVLLALAAEAAALKISLGLVVLTWVLFFLFFRIVSLASIIAAISLPVYMVLFSAPYSLTLSAIILVFFIILRHRPNINRLMQGKEKKIF